MRTLEVFNQISLDGYFTDDKRDMSWAHKHDPEWASFASENASGGGTLVFGRVTYEMMAGYWPTPQAFKAAPVVAEQMGNLPKIVFSRTLRKPNWKNTTVINDNIVGAMRKLKSEPGPDLVIMGSGTIVAQFADAGLIDAYQIVVIPVVIGRGRTLFENVKDRIGLNLEKTRAFTNGNVVLWYRRA